MKYVVTTTAQVHRHYEVEAEDEAQAKKRMRQWIGDQDSVKEGLVAFMAIENATPERISIVSTDQKVAETVEAIRKAAEPDEHEQT